MTSLFKNKKKNTERKENEKFKFERSHSPARIRTFHKWNTAKRKKRGFRAETRKRHCQILIVSFFFFFKRMSFDACTFPCSRFRTKRRAAAPCACIRGIYIPVLVFHGCVVTARVQVRLTVDAMYN